jgi:EAL domain-containing protein (putative c-di-GMP-specific phosphodiesterase class I)
MRELRDAGFGVMIGELGSGHATFSQVLGRPATGIRIDAALTRRVQGKVGAELIEAIVKLAQACNLQTTACGVDDAETAAVLTLLGVQRLQGPYFGEPMECRAFEKILEQDRHAP